MKEMSKRMEIKRGEIYWVNWNPGRGSEQGGLRPALVIQNDTGNRFSPTTIVASISTAPEKPFPFLVEVPSSESGLPQKSAINLSQILTIDKSRLRDKCGNLSEKNMENVEQAIKVSLGFKR
jgi:mRNA interferase MazF